MVELGDYVKIYNRYIGKVVNIYYRDEYFPTDDCLIYTVRDFIGCEYQYYDYEGSGYCIENYDLELLTTNEYNRLCNDVEKIVIDTKYDKSYIIISVIFILFCLLYFNVI